MTENKTVGVEDGGVQDLENHAVESGDDVKKSRKRKRNSSTLVEDDCHLTKVEKLYKRVTLCLARPSYRLKLGSNKLRSESRSRLFHLLRKLVRRHDWVEASGVLSVLLQGTCKEHCPSVNRFKYSVSMELLKLVESDRSNLTMVSDVYDTWMRKVGINLSNKRSGHLKEGSFVVRLESILFRLMQGYFEGERQNARSLLQEHDFDSHPMFNMITGLIFCQLWYSCIPEDIRWKESDHIDKLATSTHSDMSAAPSQPDMSGTRFSYQVGDSEEHNAVFNDKSATLFQYDSDTSVRNDKELSVEADSDLHREVVPMDVDFNVHREDTPLDIRPQGFYVNAVEDDGSVDDNGGHMHFVPNLSVLKSLDPWLLPLRTENWELDRVILDDEHKNAVKYLRESIHSTPLSLAALLPLIQLLLIGCRDQEALNELERFCGSSSMSLPVRLKATLLERIYPNDSLMLSTCFEETLRRDPTCSQSLARLVSMHKNGHYSPESLLEMIALHLDAVFAEHNTWREFALCFLKVYQYEEDRMSVCWDGDEGGQKQRYSVSYNRVPKLFMDGKSGKAWRLRCRWWLTRHFSWSMLSSETAAGDLQLLAYKAACASHMYGHKSEYVVKAHTCLENENNNKDLIDFLRLHMRHSIGLNVKFQERTS